VYATITDISQPLSGEEFLSDFDLLVGLPVLDPGDVLADPRLPSDDTPELLLVLPPLLDRDESLSDFVTLTFDLVELQDESVGVNFASGIFPGPQLFVLLLLVSDTHFRYSISGVLSVLYHLAFLCSCGWLFVVRLLLTSEYISTIECVYFGGFLG
jgi:hypothetical protein